MVRKNGKNSSKKGCECAVTTLCPFLKRSKGGIYKTLNNPRWFDNNVPSILHSTTKMCMLRIFLRLQISGRVASWFLHSAQCTILSYLDEKNSTSKKKLFEKTPQKQDFSHYLGFYSIVGLHKRGWKFNMSSSKRFEVWF